MATKHINFGSFEGWAGKLDSDNKRLLEKLDDICVRINSLEATYKSNASTTIREKITAMKPRFIQYYQVVDAYVRFVKSTGEAYKNTENINNTRASEFI